MSSTGIRRRFTWFDAAALTGVTVLGFFVARDLVESYEQVKFILGPEFACHWLVNWNTAGVSLFASWSLTLFALRLRAPRPRLRDLARGPGFVTGVVVALLTSRQVVVYLVETSGQVGKGLASLSYWELLTSFASYLVISATESAGLLVAATWFALLPGRWWRPEASWIDRAGRCLGCYWIAMFVIECYVRMIS